MDKLIMHECMEYLSKIDLQTLRNKRVLITGANGLIGTYIIYLLHVANLHFSLNIDIIAVSKHEPRKILKPLFQSRYDFRSVDLTRSNISEVCPEKVDYIIHAAGYATPALFMSNPLECIKLNTSVTEKMLVKAKDNKASLLFLSSSEIYGEPKVVPTPEDYHGCCSSVGPRSAYSESKRLGETLCYCFRNNEAVRALVTRISITYGPGTDINDNRVLSNFIKMALKDRVIQMRDQGQHVRTFCYILDCIIMLLNVLLFGTDFVYNVGGVSTVSIRELAEKICYITKSNLIYPELKDTKSDNHSGSSIVKLDISKVCNEFKFKDFINMEDGLVRTIKWNEDNWVKG